MSLKKTYSCNLCTETKEPSELVCLYWSMLHKSKTTDKHGRYIITQNIADSDKHLCSECIELIKEMK